MIGKKHYQKIVTLTECKSRFTFLRKIELRTADQVSSAMTDLLQPVTDRVQTHTADNGKGFAEHEKISQELKVGFYFVHLYTV